MCESRGGRVLGSPTLIGLKVSADCGRKAALNLNVTNCRGGFRRTIDYYSDESCIGRCLSSDAALREQDRAKASIFHSFIRRGLVRACMSPVVVCI